MELRYLYVGAEDTEVELEAWLAAAGTAHPRWRFQAFGADVAAVDMGAGPAVLVADHRPSGSVLPIYAVEDLDQSRATLEAAGWRSEGPAAGTPEGPTVAAAQPVGHRGGAAAPRPAERDGDRVRRSGQRPPGQAVRPSRWAASL